MLYPGYIRHALCSPVKGLSQRGNIIICVLWAILAITGIPIWHITVSSYISLAPNTNSQQANLAMFINSVNTGQYSHSRLVHAHSGHYDSFLLTSCSSMQYRQWVRWDMTMQPMPDYVIQEDHRGIQPWQDQRASLQCEDQNRMD